MRGFTLLEVLIAIMITALLALGTLGLVNQFSMTHERVGERMDALDRLQAARRQLEQDMEQFVPHRPVGDEFNNLQPALVSDDETLLTLTRHGWSRTVFDPPLRSDLQRLEYTLVPIQNERCRMGLTSEQWADRDSLSGACLIRRYRQHLEAEADNPWREQVVLAPLDDIKLAFVSVGADGNRETYPQWPVDDGETAASLRAIGITLDFATFAPAEFVWAVPGAVLPESSDEEAS